MKIKVITDYLETIAPLALQENYDNAGLIIGNPDADVTSALICLDSTEEVLDEAIKKKCGLIIAHHPVIFGGLKKINGKNYVERVVMKAIKNNIAVYAAHTNFDNIQTGVNKKICEKIGLKNCKILFSNTKLLRKLVTFCPVQEAENVRNAIFKAGAGSIGNYGECSFNVEGFGTFRGNENSSPYVGKKGNQHHEKELRIETIYPYHLEQGILKALFENHPYEEVAYDIYPLENRHALTGSGMTGELIKEENEIDFLKRVKRVMNAGSVRHTKLLGKKIKTVAVCGGSGSFLLSDAIAEKADAFITSDVKYHQFFDAENKIIIADIGHYETEQFTGELFLEFIRKQFPIFVAHLSKTNTNPLNYL